MSLTDDVTDDFLNTTGSKEFVEVKPSDTSVGDVSQLAKGLSAPQEDSSTEDETPSAKLDDGPSLVGSDYPPEYLRIVNRINAQYALLPVLDNDLIYKEISDLTIRSSPTPTLEVLNDELHKVQSAKDRLSEILINVIKAYNFKKRAVDILKDAWGKFCSEKNAESRKGDASFRLSFFLIDFAETESLFKSCDHILRNLDSLQDNLSRRITIWQLILKLREGRMALPDYDFGKEASPETISGFFSEDAGKSDEEKNKPKLQEF
jgi:hypothetical protein